MKKRRCKNCGRQMESIFGVKNRIVYVCNFCGERIVVKNGGQDE